MGKRVRKIWNAVTSVLVALVVVLALALVGVRLVGFQVFTVLSGSMEPVYPVGSVLYVKEAGPEPLAAGQAITFRMGGDLVATHRIIEVVPEGGSVAYRTKGDANDAADGSLVPHENVIGTPVLCIPWLGYFADYVQKPPGSYAALSAGAILLLLVFLPDLLPGKKKKGRYTGKYTPKS